MIESFFKKEKTPEKEKKVVVTFHFTSGKTLDLLFIEEDFRNRVLESLKTSWDGTRTFSDNEGINFKYVTHYEINEEEN